MTTNEDGTVTLSKTEAENYERLRVQAFLNSHTPISRSGECSDPTWRGWLRACFWALFDEGEGFSGKRPLGNSGWLGDLIECLEGYGLTIDTLLSAMFEQSKS